MIDDEISRLIIEIPRLISDMIYTDDFLCFYGNL